MRSMLLLSFALLPTAALAQARTISSVAPETTMTAAISGSSAVNAAVTGAPAHIASATHIREIIRTRVDGNTVSNDDNGNSITFGHPNFETAPKLIKWSNIPVTVSELPSAETSVAVSFLLDRSGTPDNVQIAHSGGVAVDQDVIEAVKNFRFQAATEEHQPIEKMMTLTVIFRKN